jgi:hypothetical protein
MKREGTHLWLVVALLAALQLLLNRRHRDLPRIWIPGALLILAFEMSMEALDALPYSDSFSISIAGLIGRMDRLRIVAPWMTAAVLSTKSWSLLWPGSVLAVATLLFQRRFALARTFGGGIGLSLLLIGAAYIVGFPTNLEANIANSIDRLLLQIAPLAILTIGVTVSQARRKPDEEQRPYCGSPTFNLQIAHLHE